MDNSNADGTSGPIVILGGTGEARELAARLRAMGRRAITTLAGRTAAPLLPAGEVRIGGFGGAKKLAEYLGTLKASLLIDATHPFAARISANAVRASEMSGTPLIRLERPGWTRPEGADWITVADMADAAAAPPAGARVVLTIGRQELEVFYPRTDCPIVARVIEEPPGIPDDWRVIAAKGPFALEDELALLRDNAITHLVTKNSGGNQTAAKLEAAHTLGVTVVMVARPFLPPARTVESVEALLRFV